MAQEKLAVMERSQTPYPFETKGSIGRIVLWLIGLVFLAVAISQLVVGMDLYFVVFAAVAAVAAIVIAQRFEAGLIVYLLIAPFNWGGTPSVLGQGASYHAGFMPSQMGLILLCGFWIGKALFGRGQQMVKTRLNAAVIAFFTVAVASTISAMFIWNPNVQHYDKQIWFPITEVGMWVLCVLSFYLTASMGERREWLEFLFWPVVLIGLWTVAFQFSGTEMPNRIVRAGFMPAYGAVMVCARLFLKKDKPAMKGLLVVLLGLFATSAVVARDWVSGLLTAIIGIGVILLFTSKRLFAWVTVLGILFLVVYPPFIDSMYSQSRHEGDLDRMIIWKDSVSMASATNPVLGIGPADYLTYARVFGTVWYGTTTYTNAHSDYAQMIAEMGLLGIAAFLWLVVAGIRTGVDSYKKTRQGSRWFAAAATAIFTAIALTSVVGDYLLPSRVNGAIWTFGTSVYPWVLLGAAVAIAKSKDNDTEDLRWENDPAYNSDRQLEY